MSVMEYLGSLGYVRVRICGECFTVRGMANELHRNSVGLEHYRVKAVQEFGEEKIIFVER